MERSHVVAMAASLALTSGCSTESPMPPAVPQTKAELTKYDETSRYADVRAFIDTLAQQTPHMRVEMFGRSEEGRELPLLIVGDPPVAATLARNSATKPLVLMMANIHAGEVEGKEATLHLVRRLTLGDLQPLRPSADWLFVPIYNADGNENISLDNRVEQHGPIGGVGTRENTKGLDLNRDSIKLESSEARALVSLLTTWSPDVVVDLHTTNGSYHGYHLTYAPPLNPNTDPGIAAFTRETMLPAVRTAMNARHGFRIFDYGNFATAGDLDAEMEGFAANDTRQRAWRTFDARPRFVTNYAGLRNRIAILSEAYSYLGFERRVKVTEAFVEEIMRFVAANTSAITTLGLRADANWIDTTPREQGIASALQALPTPVDVLVGAVSNAANPRSGKSMRTMNEGTAIPTSMTVYDRFASTTTRRVPDRYIVPASSRGLHEAVERKLREHGILVEKANVGTSHAVEQFVIGHIRHAPQAFQGHRAVSLQGTFESRTVDIPAGSLVVTTRQALGRLVFYMLEPESDDSLTTWNFFDEALKVGAAHPVLKSTP